MVPVVKLIPSKWLLDLNFFINFHQLMTLHGDTNKWNTCIDMHGLCKRTDMQPGLCFQNLHFADFFNSCKLLYFKVLRPESYFWLLGLFQEKQ